MISHVVKIAEGMKEKKRIKTKIGVGSVVKSKVGDMEENTRGVLNPPTYRKRVTEIQGLLLL